MARAGGDKRGSTNDRFRRKLWLIGAIEDPSLGFAPFDGDGSKVMCFWGCGRELNLYTVEADRIVPGGSYRRDNIVPACRPCNLARSDDQFLTVEGIAARVAATTDKRGSLVPALSK
jgi:hypothetical protein